MKEETERAIREYRAMQVELMRLAKRVASEPHMARNGVSLLVDCERWLSTLRTALAVGAVTGNFDLEMVRACFAKDRPE